jgi:RNA polymerase sigma-70 factor, ECF subfamily
MAASAWLLPGEPANDDGDEAMLAFEHLVREHAQVLMRTALHLAGSRHEAEDLVQDTFERGLRKFSALRQDANHRAWLVRILHNRFIDQYRRRSRLPAEQPLSPVVDVPEVEPDAPPPWAGVTPEQLDTAVARLDEQFRAVYLLRVMHGLSYEEIAARLEIRKATVGTRMVRARRRLRALLTSP